MNLSTTQKDYLLAILSGGFLFILPFTHTVAIRLSFLLLLFIALVFIYPFKALQKIHCKNILLLWMVFPLLILPFAWDISYSLNEIKVEIGYSLIAFSLFFILAYQKVFFVKSALFAATVSLIVLSLWGGWNSYWNGGIWLETARHNGSASYISYTLILLPFLIFSYFLLSQYRRFILAIAILLIITSFVSGQRVFVFALVAEMVVFLLWVKHHFKLNPKKLILISSVFILLSALLALGSLLNRFDGSIAAAIHYQQNDPRLSLLSIPIDLIKHAPLLGYGFGRETMLHVLGGEAVLEQILANYPHGYQYNHAHNLFLNYAIEVGLLGLLIFAVLFSCLFQHYYACAKQSKRLVAVAGMAGMAILVGFLIRNQSNDMFYRDISLFFWSIQGVLLGFIAKMIHKD